MGTGQKTNRLLVPEASKAMYDFKYEVANEIGIANQIQGDYWGYLSSRDCGAVGGNMVRKMIQAYQESVAQGSPLPNQIQQSQQQAPLTQNKPNDQSNAVFNTFNEQ